MTLKYFVDGADDAPVLVLLHAIATSSRLWLPQLGVLAQSFRIVRIDLPGHGESELLPGGAGYADYADAVAATLTNAGIDRYTLAGLSFGAMVSMQLAVRHAPHVRSVVLANCAALTPPPVAAMWQSRIAAADRDGMASQVAGTLDRWFTPAFATSAPLTLDWVKGMIEQTPVAGFVAAARMICGLDHMALLPHIACPALVLAGAHDQAAPLAGPAAISRAISQGRLEIIEAAHLSNVEAPVAFTEAVGRFALER